MERIKVAQDVLNPTHLRRRLADNNQNSVPEHVNKIIKNATYIKKKNIKLRWGPVRLQIRIDFGTLGQFIILVHGVNRSAGALLEKNEMR